MIIFIQIRILNIKPRKIQKTVHGKCFGAEQKMIISTFKPYSNRVLRFSTKIKTPINPFNIEPAGAVCVVYVLFATGSWPVKGVIRSPKNWKKLQKWTIIINVRGSFDSLKIKKASNMTRVYNPLCRIKSAINAWCAFSFL